MSDHKPVTVRVPVDGDIYARLKRKVDLGENWGHALMDIIQGNSPEGDDIEAGLAKALTDHARAQEEIARLKEEIKDKEAQIQRATLLLAEIFKTVIK